MNREHLHRQSAVESSRVPRPAPLLVAKEAPAPRPATPAVLPSAALDDRIAIVDTAGSGKTYTAKGFVEQGRRILAELPRLRQGEGYLWAPGHELLERMQFPLIRTFDSSCTPRRGERPASPRTLAEVDLSAITAALAATTTPNPGKLDRHEPTDDRRLAEYQGELAAAKQRIAELEQENRDLVGRMEQIVALAFGPFSTAKPARATEQLTTTHLSVAPQPRSRASSSHGADGDIRGAARKLLIAAAQHAPGRFTWGQLATLAGLKPSGGHFNAGRKQLRQSGYVDETNNLVGTTKTGLKAAGTVPSAPSTPAERLALWCERLPAPAPEILRTRVPEPRRRPGDRDDGFRRVVIPSATPSPDS